MRLHPAAGEPVAQAAPRAANNPEMHRRPESSIAGMLLSGKIVP
jgi:hypothetical protein